MLKQTAALTLALALAIAVAVMPGSPTGAEEPALTPAQEERIREILRDYLIEHPEVLIESLRGYEEQQRLATEKRQRDALGAHRAALVEDPAAPVLGNAKGDVVVVEFFDYRCPYCKKVAATLREVMERDGGIRLVMKEFPILGQSSLYAARAALAAHQQGKYEAFHFALMELKGELDEPTVLETADQVGIDRERLKADMLSPEIDAALRRNYQLADALDINGTPAFVIGDELVPGAIDSQALIDLIAKARDAAG